MIPRYQFEPIANIWAEKTKYQLWLKIELAFLRNFTGRTFNIELNDMDLRQIKYLEDKTKHDVAAFVEWLEPLTSNKLHYGLTSSDIVDTAFSMQIRETNVIVRHLLSELNDRLAELAKRHPKLHLLGRTHGQAAEIIAFSHKCKEWTNNISWLLSSNFTYYGKLSGSVGDYKYFEKDLADDTLNDLGLSNGDTVSQGQVISRAVYASYAQWWSLVASCLEKIAVDIRLLAQTGIEELFEGRVGTQIGSSSMPHKRNPIACENICGVARVIRGYASTALENVALWAERDISHSSAERIIFPDAAELLGYAINKLSQVITNIEVSPANMEKNALGTVGITSQLQMLELIDKGMSRKEAHETLRAKIAQIT